MKANACTLLAPSFLFSLIIGSNSHPGNLLLARKPTESTTRDLPTWLNSPRMLLLSVRRTRPSGFTDSVIIGASIAIVMFVLLAIVLTMMLKRLRLRRRRYVSVAAVARPPRPPSLRLDTEYPVEMKPAYLDSPRMRRASIVARDPLSPLAVSQQPGFIPRPPPLDIPVSVAGSDIGDSVSFNPRRPSAAVTVEELDELAEELSRHYVLTDPGSPVLRHGHRHSASLVGRVKASQASS